jgi:hypothetical protein
MRLSDGERMILDACTAPDGRWFGAPYARAAEILVRLGFLRRTAVDVGGIVVEICVVTEAGRLALEVDEGRLRDLKPVPPA